MQDIGVNTAELAETGVDYTAVEPYADGYVEDTIVNADDAEAIAEAATQLANRAQENRKKFNDC